MKSVVSIFFAVFALVGFSTAAIAEDVAPAQVGIAFGQSELEDNEEDGSSWQIWYGKQRDATWSWEIGYFDSGDIELDAGGDATADGFTASLLGNTVLGEKVTGYARGGLFFWDVEGKGTSPDFEDDGNDIFYGIGLRYDYSETINLRAEYTAYKLDGDIVDTDLDVMSIGLEYTLAE